MARILAPNTSYQGVSATVQFAQGVGSTDDPHLIDWFRQHGYTVLEEAPAMPEPPAVDQGETPVAGLDTSAEPPEPEPPAVDQGEKPVAGQDTPPAPATRAKRGGK